MSVQTACRQQAELGNQLWIVVNIDQNSFAINALDVHDMVAMPPLTRLPGTEQYLSGTINHRGQIVPLVDFRVLLGRKSIAETAESLCSLIDQREDDHRNWLDQLELSVKEKREFALATDPHKCAFGKWYDSYTTDDLVLQGLLRKFDTPHRTIHAIAEKVKKYEVDGEFEAAFTLIEQTREHELSVMIELFAAFRQIVREQTRRQVAVILEHEGAQVAFSVDAVDAVEELSAELITDAADVFPAEWKNWIVAIGRRSKADGLALILDQELFFELAARVEPLVSYPAGG